MKKSVNGLVNKSWAAAVKLLLTGNSPDTTTLYTRLLTITGAEKQALKSQAAQARLDTATKAVSDAVKYGWAFGINAEKAAIHKPANFNACRRVRSLLPLAIAAGEAIGKEQAARIERAHGLPKAGTFPLRHTHAAPPA